MPHCNVNAPRLGAVSNPVSNGVQLTVPRESTGALTRNGVNDIGEAAAIDRGVKLITKLFEETLENRQNKVVPFELRAFGLVAAEHMIKELLGELE
jgi:hypothetical protein